MSKIWSTMDLGKRAMMNSKSALHTVSHNISNKETEGYTRQRVELKTTQPLREGSHQYGQGSTVATVRRVTNPFIEKQLEREGNNLGELLSKSGTLRQVENIFNEQVNKGLNKFVTEFFNSFRELSQNPENLAARTAVMESANSMTEDFSRINNGLEAVSGDIDSQMRLKVSEINQMVKEISGLNEQIGNVEAQGAQANDQRDRRDLLIKKLGQKIDIKYAENRSGMLTITAANTVVLVSGTQSKELSVAASPASEGKKEGELDIYYPRTGQSPALKITNLIRSGELHGLIDARSNMVNGFQKKMDQLAFNLGKEVNDIHFQGFNLYDQSGNFFFKPMDKIEGAAKALTVSDTIKNDVALIGAGGTANAPGDNRVANLVSLLQYKKFMEAGTASMDDFYGSIVAKTGIDANRANSELSSQEDALLQLNNIRESMSGVSLDEETTKMIEYQKMFDASARIIKTVDEMLETVLNLKRI